MAKEIVEPMFAQMLPGPLASLRFVKLDLGTVPMRVSAVEVHKIDDRGIKLDLDIEWDGQCDIELDGKMIPKVVSGGGRTPSRVKGHAHPPRVG
jgi:hypothetical protein